MDSWRSSAIKKVLAASMAGLVSVCILAGCQPVFLAKDIYCDAHSSLPAKLEKDHCPVTGPLSELTKAPPTVNLPERTPLHLKLEDAFTLALQTGNTGGRGPGGGGAGKVSDEFLSATGIGGSFNAQSENIRILRLQPANAYAGLEATQSRFDALSYTSINWQNTDGLAQGLQSFQNGHSANFVTGIMKPFSTGGVFTFGLVGSYTNLNTPPTGAFSTLNPLYQLRAVAGVELPLLKDAGVEINQLLSRLPPITGLSLNQSASGAALNAYNARQGVLSSFVDRNTEGILISRLRFDQQRAEFERQVNLLIVNTEVAYWNLYKAYGQLYITEENLRVMHEIWQQAHNRWKAGNMPPETYFLILGQYQEFRGERIRTLQETLTAEQELRGLIGLTVEDGCRLVPITQPTLTELKPDWTISLEEAFNSRPELQMARDNLRYHQYLMSIQKNSLRPDLRAFARFEPVGFGTTLTGNGEFIDGTGTPRPSNAARSLASTHYLDYTFGLQLSMPLGYRAELAALRAARLELTQAFLLLRDQEDKTARFLASTYQDLPRQYRGIEAHRSERLAYGKGLTIRLDQLRTGKLTLAGSDKEGPLVFLDAQRRYAAAFSKEFNAIADYNVALARHEWAKGTILRYNNIHIAEGALPEHVQARKAEFDRERAKSLVLFDRPDALLQPGRVCATKEEELTLPPTPTQVDDLPPLRLPAAESKADKLPLGPRPQDTYILPTGGLKSNDILWTPTLPTKRPANTHEPLPLPVMDRPPLPVEPTASIPTNPSDLSAKEAGTLGHVTMEESPIHASEFPTRAAPTLPTLAPGRITIGGPVSMLDCLKH